MQLPFVNGCFPEPCSLGLPLIFTLFIIGFLVGVPIVMCLVDGIKSRIKGDNVNDTEATSK